MICRGNPPASDERGQLAVQVPQFMQAVMSPPPNFATSLWSPGWTREPIPSSYFSLTAYRK